jgi:hypothetical protein
VQTSAGHDREVADLGALDASRPATLLVTMHGLRVTASVDGGRPVVLLAGDALVHGAGLIAGPGQPSTHARWSGFSAVPEPSPGLLDPATATIRDSFERELRVGLGATDTGQAWVGVHGGWGLHPGTAHVSVISPDGINLAMIDTGFVDGTVEASFGVVDNGAGVAFRCKDAANCWWVQGARGYGTWVVQRTVDGKTTVVGTFGTTGAVSGSTVSVQMHGRDLTFFLNGKPRFRVSSQVLMDARGAGLFLLGSNAQQSTWVRFLAAPEPR